MRITDWRASAYRSSSDGGTVIPTSQYLERSSRLYRVIPAPTTVASRSSESSFAMVNALGESPSRRRTLGPADIRFSTTVPGEKGIGGIRPLARVKRR